MRVTTNGLSHPSPEEGEKSESIIYVLALEWQMGNEDVPTET